MGAPRVYRTEAVVLRRTNLGEADKILTLLTPREGTLKVVAKAIRRPSAKLSGHLDLFCRSDLQIARGKNLDVVTGAQMIDGYLTIRDDLFRSSCAMYLLEFADSFSVEGLANPALYTLLIEALEHLDAGRNTEMTLRYFDLHALDAVGYRPQLRTCVVCDTSIEPDVNRYGPSGITCPHCQPPEETRPISVEALKVLRFLQTIDMETAQRLKPSAPVVGELDNHLRRSVRILLERELRSTSLLDSVRPL